jgi:hypothetical protein
MSVTVIVTGPPPPPPGGDDGLRAATPKPRYSLTVEFDDSATPAEIAHGVERGKHSLAKLNE